MKKKYEVTYDTLHNNHYYPHTKIVEAENQKEACQLIKDHYWYNVESYASAHNVCNKTARRNFYYPFHITAR